MGSHSFTCHTHEPYLPLLPSRKQWRHPMGGCHPYLFSPEKLTFLAHHCCHFYWFQSGVTPGGCHSAPILPVRPRLSTIFCKFTHKNYSPSYVTPGGCHPGGPLSP